MSRTACPNRCTGCLREFCKNCENTIHPPLVFCTLKSNTLVLACSGFLISDLHISSQVMGEKDEVKDKWIKEGCKRGPLSPRGKIQGKTHGPKRSSKTQRSENGGTTEPYTTTVCQWWWARTVVVGRTTMLSGRTAVRPYLPRVLQFLSCLFVFLCNFLVFFPLKDNVSGHFGKNFTPFYSPFSIFFSVY